MFLRPEHPKPQFERANWMNLNGVWGFEIDNAGDLALRELQECACVGLPHESKADDGSFDCHRSAPWFYAK